MHAEETLINKMGLEDESYLVGVSLFLMVGYHLYLWQCFINKPLNTTFGFQSQARKAWFNQITQVGDEKKSMQVVQSLRNNMMIIILRGTISIIVSSSVAAFTNNAYNYNRGGKSSRLEWVYAVKYACAFMVLMWGFMCSSLGVGFLIDTSVSVSVSVSVNGEDVIERMIERGFMLSFIGNRLMWVGLLLLLWSFTPIALLLGSLALISGFFIMDFGDNNNGSFRFSLGTGHVRRLNHEGAP